MKAFIIMTIRVFFGDWCILCNLTLLKRSLEILRPKGRGLNQLIIIAGCLLPGSLPAQSQLCTGSLGDPIVNIDFGSGTSSRGGPLDAGITSYLFSTNSSDDGYYSIASSTGGMNQNWFTTVDHTPGDANGYMMVVNASETPGEFYRVKITGLCPGTKYEAAAWVMNLLTGYDGLKPDITFRVQTTDGMLIDNEYNTGSIPQSSTPEWKQYGFYFTTPVNVQDVVLIIRNNGPGGRGNDIALDDITFRPCGPDVKVTGILFNNTAKFCEGEDITVPLSADISSEFIDPLMQWQIFDGLSWQDIQGETTKQFTISVANASPGTYLYRLAVGERLVFDSEKCRVNSGIFSIIVNPKPVPAVQSNSPVCYGNNLILTATDGGTYSWTGPGGFTSSERSPVLKNIDASAAGVYHVVVTSASGCQQSGQTTVAVNPPPVAEAGEDAVICSGTSTVLHAQGGSSYKWLPVAGLSDPESSDPVASPDKTTVYTVYVSDGSCTVTDDVTVTVLNPAIANAGPDKSIIEGDSIVLEGTAKGSPGFSYFWSPSDHMDNPLSLTPKVSPSDDITYTLNAVSNTGCSSSTDEVFVKVFKKLVIPNTFSPNGDGMNDTWNIEALSSYSQSDVKVYNRYGSLVLSETGYLKPWDGKFEGRDLPPGVYYYVITPKPRLRPESYKGWVLIIR